MIKVEHMTPTGRILQAIAKGRTSPRPRPPNRTVEAYWNERSDDWLINGHSCIPVHIYKIRLSALAFAVGLDEKRTADKAEPALITLQDQIASKLDIGSIRIVKAGHERRIMTIVLPAAVLTALLGIGTLLYTLIH